MTEEKIKALYDEKVQAALTLADLVDGNVTPGGELDWNDDLQDALDDYREACEAYDDACEA